MSIIWLASYPKSGNTWLRIFLANYLNDALTPVDINNLALSTPVATARDLHDRLLGIETSDLTPAEIDAHRPAAYEHLARQTAGQQFVKVHEPYRRLHDGRPLFPAAVSEGAVYLVRNPLDVAVSAAAHFDVPLATAVGALDRPGSVPDTPGLPEQFHYWPGPWHEHVRSWLEEPAFPVHLVRYEEMHRAPMETFGNILRFLQWPVEPDRLRRALDFSRFDCLQAQEARHGFAERQSRKAPFFRRGRPGSWHEALDEATMAQIMAAQGEMMARLGYLSPIREQGGSE